jgi:hypothetical protein
VILPLAAFHGVATAASAVVHVVTLEYLPFILLLFALFTISGGIRIKGNLHGSPLTNATLLLIGTGLASLIGTTGASMVMIRPLLRANDNRRYNVHVVVFFIFLVSNIGGSLTPLGDPPLFLGFLRGVDFFWTTTHLFAETLFVAGIVFAVFLVVDVILYRRETDFLPPVADPTPDSVLGVKGLYNLAFIGVVIAAILMSAYWKPGITFEIGGARLELQNVLRDTIFVATALASYALTSPFDREANGFSWGTHQGSRQALRRHLPVHGAGARHAARRPAGPVRAARRARQQPRREPEQRRLFLAHGRPVVVPRQRPDVSRVLRARRRRRRTPHDHGRADARGDLVRRGVHGRELVYRQRARTSWSTPSRRTPACACRASSATWCGRRLC